MGPTDSAISKKKMELLLKGTYTDCCFSVGPNRVKVHACKIDLCVCKSCAMELYQEFHEKKLETPENQTNSIKQADKLSSSDEGLPDEVNLPDSSSTEDKDTSDRQKNAAPESNSDGVSSGGTTTEEISPGAQDALDINKEVDNDDEKPDDVESEDDSCCSSEQPILELGKDIPDWVRNIQVDCMDDSIIMEEEDVSTFKLVMEFIHTSGFFLTGIDSEFRYAKLAAQAQKFGMEHLLEKSVQLMYNYLNTGNVWKIYDKYHGIKLIDDACATFIANNTTNCLNQETFLWISERTLIKFLQLENMNLSSELELVYACLKFVNALLFDDGKDMKINIAGRRDFCRRAIIPYLRLLNVRSMDELQPLNQYLNKEDIGNLFSLRAQPPVFPKQSNGLSNGIKFCLDRRPRMRGERNPPAKQPVPFSESRLVLDPKTPLEKIALLHTFKAQLTMPCNLEMTELQVLCSVDDRESFVWDDSCKLNITINSNGKAVFCENIRPTSISGCVARFTSLPIKTIFKGSVVLFEAIYTKHPGLYEAKRVPCINMGGDKLVEMLGESPKSNMFNLMALEPNTYMANVFKKFSFKEEVKS
ncbi:Hypothetical predicted protein [Cloeon dipterum]|uniref:BACK domain-containing protein n=1 Tax=Cloeon dipterum TaxID=197152 RepID=A0A8S1DHJ8_9INSE|nr:Hypothetical predicted protein [Cloeon dipterum]